MTANEELWGDFYKKFTDCRKRRVNCWRAFVCSSLPLRSSACGRLLRLPGLWRLPRVLLPGPLWRIRRVFPRPRVRRPFRSRRRCLQPPESRTLCADFKALSPAALRLWECGLPDSRRRDFLRPRAKWRRQLPKGSAGCRSAPRSFYTAQPRRTCHPIYRRQTKNIKR